MSFSDKLCLADCRDAGVEDEYLALLDEGNTPQFAAMCALRKAPGLNGTERALMEGDVINHGLADMPDWMRYNTVARAKKAGINITGKVFKSGLGRPDDPLAWIGGIDDLSASVKAKGLNCQGVFNHKVADPDPTPDVPLSEKSIKNIAAEYAAQDPEFSRKNPNEMREMIIEKHGAGSKYKNPKPKKNKYVPHPDDPN